MRESERIAERELGEDRWGAKHERCEQAIAELGQTLADLRRGNRWLAL